MPDLLGIFLRWWKFMVGFTLLAGLLAFIGASLSPKQFLSVATALPANSVAADKARLFNANIQVLYPELGSPDELDRVEGTAVLDTIYIKAAHRFGLAAHYDIKGANASYKAALQLKKSSVVNKSGYGELKVKVWDRDPQRAADLANFLLATLQDLHQQLQAQNNRRVLERITLDQASRQLAYRKVADSLTRASGTDAELLSIRKAALASALQQDERLLGEYGLLLQTAPGVLLTVEPARPSVYADKPRRFETVLVTLVAAGFFSLLIAVAMEGKKIRSHAQKAF